MSIVGGGGVRDTSGAADVGVAQLVGEALKLVCRELIVVP